MYNWHIIFLSAIKPVIKNHFNCDDPITMGEPECLSFLQENGDCDGCTGWNGCRMSVSWTIEQRKK